MLYTVLMETPSAPLPTDTKTLQALVKDLQSLVYNKEVQVRKLQEQLKLQQQHRYGSSSEKVKQDTDSSLTF